MHISGSHMHSKSRYGLIMLMWTLTETQEHFYFPHYLYLLIASYIEDSSFMIAFSIILQEIIFSVISPLALLLLCQSFIKLTMCMCSNLAWFYSLLFIFCFRVTIKQNITKRENYTFLNKLMLWLNPIPWCLWRQHLWIWPTAHCVKRGCPHSCPWVDSQFVALFSWPNSFSDYCCFMLKIQLWFIHLRVKPAQYCPINA